MLLLLNGVGGARGALALLRATRGFATASEPVKAGTKIVPGLTLNMNTAITILA